MSVAQREPLVAAPPYRPSLLDSARVATIAIGTVLTVLIGAVPLEYMLPGLAGLGLLIAMLAAPILGLYAVAVRDPVLAHVRGGGRRASVSRRFEPLALLLILFWIMRGLTRREIFAAARGALRRADLVAERAVPGWRRCDKLSAGHQGDAQMGAADARLHLHAGHHPRRSGGARRADSAVSGGCSARRCWGAVQFVLGIGPPAFAIGGFMRAYGIFGQPNPFARLSRHDLAAGPGDGRWCRTLAASEPWRCWRSR